MGQIWDILKISLFYHLYPAYENLITHVDTISLETSLPSTSVGKHGLICKKKSEN